MNDETQLDETDRRLLTEIAGLYTRLDPPPAHLAERSKYAMTVAAHQAEVAQLITNETLAVRDDATLSDLGMRVTFNAGDVSVMVRESDPTGERATLDGWVTPPEATIEIHCRDVVRRVQADASGRFVLPDLPRAGWWLVIWPDGPRGHLRPVVTPTVEM